MTTAGALLPETEPGVLPVDVVVDGHVVGVVIVVRLECLDLTVAGSHHHVAVVQEHLTYAVLDTRGKCLIRTSWTDSCGRRQTGSGSHLVLVVEHEPLLLLCPEAEAGMEVVPQGRNVAQTQVQVALTREVSLTRHLDTHSFLQELKGPVK